jgi:hypothetical protein
MLISACNLLNYIPNAWKTVEVIMILKPGKKLSEVESYWPIPLLSIMLKLFEKLVLQHIKPIIEEKHLVPMHKFGFRKKITAIEQVHHITYIIERRLHNKGLCSAVFLDIAQAFDRVWHGGLLHKLRSGFLNNFYQVLKSYLTN